MLRPITVSAGVALIVAVASVAPVLGEPPVQARTLLNRHVAGMHVHLETKESPPTFGDNGSGVTVAAGSVIVHLGVERGADRFNARASVSYSGVPSSAPPRGVLVLPLAVALGDFSNFTVGQPVSTSVGTFTFTKIVVDEGDIALSEPHKQAIYASIAAYSELDGGGGFASLASRIAADLGFTSRLPGSLAVAPATLVNYSIKVSRQAATTTGTALDSKGKPVSNAFVQLVTCTTGVSTHDRCQDAPDPSGQGAMCAFVASAIADAVGNFQITLPVSTAPNNNEHSYLLFAGQGASGSPPAGATIGCYCRNGHKVCPGGGPCATTQDGCGE